MGWSAFIMLKKVYYCQQTIFLPKITPNISYWFHGDDNPLQSYLTSLETMKQLDVDYVIPSHGKPFYGANDRIDELLKHHEERLEETLEQSVLNRPSTKHATDCSAQV